MTASKDVDALIARADTLAIEEGHSPDAVRACDAAVAAARALIGQLESRDNRRRLGRALWRQATTAAAGGDGAAIAMARESVELTLSVLRESSVNEPGFDDLIGECATHLADLGLLFAVSGDRATADRLLREAKVAAELSPGPAARLARATAMRIAFKIAAQDAGDRARRREQSAADTARLLRTGQDTVTLLWEVADDDRPTTLLDLADGLRDLGFAHIIAARHQPAANALAEAYGIYSCFDGPTSKRAVDTILTALNRLGTAPGVQVVVPMPGSWRLASRKNRPRHY